MPKLTVTLGQMPIYLGDLKRNFNNMQKWTEEAARRQSHIVVFPELWSTGYALNEAPALGQVMNQGLFAEMATLAKQNKISITGSMLEKRGVDTANSAPFFAANGQTMGIYRKIHLFPLMDEHRYLKAGSSPLVMDLPWGTTAMAICYDLRFPELFRRYALDGAKIVIVPAEWPLARIEHWRALLIARAIENQCFMIGVNAAGKIGDTVFGGHSMIVDPFGKVIVEAGEDPQMLTVDIELDTVKEARAQIPVFESRRPETYETLNLPGLS